MLSGLKKQLLTLSVSLVFSVVALNQAYAEGSDISVNNLEDLSVVMSVDYGSDKSKVGLIEHGTEGRIGTTATSFFVQNNNYYILDNANKKILVVDKQNNSNSIQLNTSGYYEDIYVSDNQKIYVLDSLLRKVSELSKNGELLTEYNIPEILSDPNGLEMNTQKQIIVNQSQDLSVILTTGEVSVSTKKLEHNDVEISQIRNDRKTGKIIVDNKSKKEFVDFKVDYEEMFGGLTVNDVRENQIIFTKTEVAADIPKVMAETHVYVVNKKGEVLGAVRIPLEKMTMAPRHLIRVDNNKIYLLSTDKEALKIYELKPGKKFTKTLKDRVELYTSENNEQIKKTKGSRVSILSENGSITRAQVQDRVDKMLSYHITFVDGNLKQLSGTKLPTIYSGKKTGDSYWGIPYKWGGGDGHDEGTGSRESFGYYQSRGYQTGDIDTNGYGVNEVTGLDCSGFVGLAWHRTDQKYGTTTLGNIASNITVSNLKPMDALNDAGFHTLLYKSDTSNGINTYESSTDDQRVGSHSRTWYWLGTTNDFVPIRYNNITD
ncbi:hypothetical protein [Paenibacillus sp. YYML68]|uniref:hypothetical protein n=1 Tax=Paenibacillus sp. YYML68 TaxID=2909250 RepID=UPI002491F000|nr:hypothetical protein [Paenibacillus sp. YYML68]